MLRTFPDSVQILEPHSQAASLDGRSKDVHVLLMSRDTRIKELEHVYSLSFLYPGAPRAARRIDRSADLRFQPARAALSRAADAAADHRLLPSAAGAGHSGCHSDA